jgi:hypothetical protein
MEWDVSPGPKTDAVVIKCGATFLCLLYHFTQCILLCHYVPIWHWKIVGGRFKGGGPPGVILEQKLGRGTGLGPAVVV